MEGHVSYDDVKRAAMALLEAGQEPSVRSVLITLGTGRNMGTVSRDLRRWRQETLLALQNLEIDGMEEDEDRHTIAIGDTLSAVDGAEPVAAITVNDVVGQLTLETLRAIVAGHRADRVYGPFFEALPANGGGVIWTIPFHGPVKVRISPEQRDWIVKKVLWLLHSENK
jgi:hypothetical protein